MATVQNNNTGVNKDHPTVNRGVAASYLGLDRCVDVIRDHGECLQACCVFTNLLAAYFCCKDARAVYIPRGFGGTVYAPKPRDQVMGPKALPTIEIKGPTLIPASRIIR